MKRERNPVATIVGIIHKLESLGREKALQLVVLDDDSISGDTICLLQQKERVIGVVEDIHKKTIIKRLRRKRDRLSVKLGYRDRCAGPYQRINAGDFEIRLGSHEVACDRSISTSDIQDACCAIRKKLA